MNELNVLVTRGINLIHLASLVAVRLSSRLYREFCSLFVAFVLSLGLSSLQS